MRSLNERVTRNAKKALKDHESHLASIPRSNHRGKITLNVIAGRMADYLGTNQNSTRKHLAHCLNGTGTWRVNDVQAFAAAVYTTVDQLVALDPQRPSDATVAELLYTGLNERATSKQAREILVLLNLQLNQPEVFQLCQALNRCIIDSETREGAYEGTHSMIRHSTIWERTGRRQRRLANRDRKS